MFYRAHTVSVSLRPTMVKIFVGNLNPSSKAADLRKRFELYGKVTECDIVNNYAFVHMDSESDAEAAIAKLHNSDFDGAKINVEMSHGKRTSGGPMRRRFNDRRPRDDYRDRFRGPPRPYMDGPEGSRGPFGPESMPMRSSRFGPPAWDEGYPGPYPQRSAPRGYDYPPSSVPSRYPDREPVRQPRGPIGDAPFTPSYRGSSSVEPVPPPRDYQRKGSPPRSRFDNYETYGEYDRYREPVVPHANGTSQPRSAEYDNYGSYSGGSYDIPNRDYRDADRSRNYESVDYPYYDGHGSRSAAPPRSGSSYNYGRP
ncbi:unnamed protein product [Schistocephalus solidus]|uniref:RRM domain-containing protein n=2 Tax=Schistocephalus solidus TaxID=70667 RepID=A0A3P7D2V7_SCHSO|nr:unnamed protein product [Schistocephalus solidus]